MNTDVISNNYPNTGRVINEANLITRYQMAAFFSFTLLLSWSIWFLAPVMSGKDRYVFDSLVQIGSFGPAIAAWIVASLVNPKPTRNSLYTRIALFIFTYPISLVIWWSGRPIMMEQTTRGHWTDFAIALLPALIISGLASGKQGICVCLSSLRKWRVGAGPYLLAFLLWPALIVVGNALASALGLSVPDAPYSFSWRLLWMFRLNLLCILFYGGGNEEPGWRGFAQPMLRKNYNCQLRWLIPNSRITTANG